MYTNRLSISDLCDKSPWKERSIWWLLWFPFGIVLAVARVVLIGLLFIMSLPFPATARKNYHCRGLQAILGLRIVCNLSRDEIANRTEGCVVASNHISVYDIFTALGLPHTTILIGNTAAQNVNILNVAAYHAAIICSGANVWLVSKRREFAQHLADWRRHRSDVALYTTPEKTINNGRGLFRFNPTFLCYRMPVVPLALRITLPLAMNPHPLHSSGGVIFLRLLMMPYINYEMSFLAHQEQEQGQSKEEFSAKVQQAIANHLRIPATDWSVEDKHAWRQSQRRLMEEKRRWI